MIDLADTARAHRIEISVVLFAEADINRTDVGVYRDVILDPSSMRRTKQAARPEL